MTVPLTQPASDVKGLDWLYQTQWFGIKLGLDNVQKLLSELNLPAPNQNFIHVAGTNGKGSVCAFLHQLMKMSGVKVGLFTSPHLIEFTERIQDHTRQINEVELLEGIEKLKQLCASWEPHPTFFELTFALALDWFRKRGLDWAILETGLGGRLDATNSITPKVCVLTSIHLDHQEALGNTFEAIAREKAGIIKPGVPVVTGPQLPEVMAVISETARKQGCALKVVTRPVRGYRLGLAGQHQLWNAALAIEAYKLAGFSCDEQIMSEALSSVQWPARFQRLCEERIIVDGSHNPSAADALVRTWQYTYPGEKASIVFGGAMDKDLKSVIHSLQPIAAHWHFTNLHSPRGASSLSIEALLNELYGQHVDCTVHENLETALKASRMERNRTLITGSLYLAGEALSLLNPSEKAFEVSLQ